MRRSRISIAVPAPRAPGSGTLLLGAWVMAALALGALPRLTRATTLSGAPLVRDGLPPTAMTVADTLPAYLQGRSAHFVDWLADGSMLISTRFADSWQIHRVSAPLGMRTQLSFEPGGVITAAAQPFSSDTLVYLAARGANSQLMLEQLQEHSVRALTDGSDRVSDPVWSPHGRQLAFVSNRRGPDDDDVYVLDVHSAGAAPRLVAAALAGSRWRIEGWSADAHELLLASERGADTEGALYIADLDHGSVTAVPAGSAPRRGRSRRGRAAVDAPGAASALHAAAARFASDGSGILLLTRAPVGGGAAASTRQFLHLALFDPHSGHRRTLSGPSPYDVGLFDASADGHYLAYTLDEDGQSHLMLIDQRLQLERAVTGIPPGVISSLRFDASGQHLALTLESSRQPADVYVLNLDGDELTRWTQSEVGPVATRSFLEPQLISFPTWDQVDGQPRRLQALVYDRGADAAGSARPVVIWLCSGAGQQCRPRYTPFVQYLARQLGLVVIAPNVRGSSGLGANLLAAGAGALRPDASRDVGALLAWIGLQPGLDRSRVGLLGEGYGGYLALEALSQYPDRLLGAVVAFPPPLLDLPNLAAIRGAVLLVQAGDAGDAPGYEAAQLREGLRSQGVAVQYLAARQPDAFTRRSARNAYHAAAASFLARLLH
jgi:dipeptidyl aminopeptidase/acylaminoacyl peptidase